MKISVLIPVSLLGTLVIGMGIYSVMEGKDPADKGISGVAVTDTGRERDIIQETTVLKQQMAQLSSEVADLRHVILQMQSKNEGLSKHGSPSVNVNQEGSSTAMETNNVDDTLEKIEKMFQERDKQNARFQAKRQDRIAAIESSFLGESPDPNWSAKTEDLVQQKLAENDFKKIISSNVECRTSLCRMDVTVDQNDASKLTMSLLHKLGKLLPRSMVDHINGGDGTQTLIVYMLREGYKPPSPM